MKILPRKFNEFLHLSLHSPSDYRRAYNYGLRKTFRAQFGQTHGDDIQDTRMKKLSFTGYFDGCCGLPPKRDCIK